MDSCRIADYKDTGQPHGGCSQGRRREGGGCTPQLVVDCQWLIPQTQACRDHVQKLWVNLLDNWFLAYFIGVSPSNHHRTFATIAHFQLHPHSTAHFRSVLQQISCTPTQHHSTCCHGKLGHNSHVNVMEAHLLALADMSHNAHHDSHVNVIQAHILPLPEMSYKAHHNSHVNVMQAHILPLAEMSCKAHQNSHVNVIQAHILPIAEMSYKAHHYSHAHVIQATS